jgi:CRISPR-associated protein Cas2
MLVLFANNLPSACRGRLKLWFIEVRLSIYVSGLNNNLAEKVVTYLLSYQWDAGAILFKSKSQSPGYEIITLGKPDRKIIRLSMLPLTMHSLKS